MEAPEEFTASNDNTLLVKGKRAKRQRPFPQSAVAVTSSSSSGGGGGGGGSGASGVGSGGGNHHLDSSLPSPSTSGEISTTCQEDEDMANCLILLAQGVGRKQPEEEEERVEKSGGRRFTETAAGKPAGLFFYECKTCNRSFPSFQALGGHRASHKKLKATVEENLPVPTAAPPYEEEEEEEGGGQQTSKISPPLSFQMAAAAAAARSSQINSKSSKVHECSICGSEFSSGQALGGHMRRHRAPPNSQTAVSGGITTAEPPHEEIIGVKPRNVLPLDLNLPAPPEDDHLRDAEFQFKPNKQQQHRLVFSAPALVDCHY